VSRLPLLLWVISAAASAQGSDRNAYNPGFLGPNALPPPLVETAWIAPSPQISLGVAMQRTQSVLGADDASLVLPFRLEVPFLGRASLLFEGQPFEWWLASAQTRNSWQPSTWNGLSKADIRIGAKFLLFNGARTHPSVGLRALTKTTTGKDFFDHRFINAPGYLFDVLASHRFALPREWAIDAHASLGFLAWQQGAHGQNDAPAATVSVRLVRPEFTVGIEARGYRGYQLGDKPVLLTLPIEVTLSRWFTVYQSANAGLNDPRYFDLRTGIRVGLPVRPAAVGDLSPSQPSPYVNDAAD
jgi:hypothetical protein